MIKINKKWFIPGCLLLVLLLSGGLFVVMAAQEGTSQDPLITKSYIDNVFKPEIYGIINTAVDEIAGREAADIQQLIDAYIEQIDDKVDELNAQMGSAVDNEVFISILNAAVREKLLGITVMPSSESQIFKFVTLAAGKRLIGGVGCEIILRNGSATCHSQGGEGLLNVPQASGLLHDANLTVNTLYIVTENGNGLLASAISTLLVRGNYTVE